MILQNSQFEEFLRVNKEIFKLSKQIKQVWHRIKDIAPQNLESTSIYCDYLHHCLNSSWKAKKLYSNSLLFKEKLRNMDRNLLWQSPFRYLFSEETVVIRASAS